MSDENKDLNCEGNCDFCEDECEDMDQPTVTLTLDDDTEITCAILTIYPAGDNQYIALLPLNEESENEDGEVYLYRYLENENGQPTLENIDTDEEYDIAADAFDELMDEQEFEDLDTDDNL
ncbi:DUF1292 domain-containing protein [Blautia liquoris]|uniref:DUF1292 domain-containing protein n=1 Tax=Blautia liquoris TaxID=2779518 RepID=A0A7M2RD31_9FIRM|nr:DUF1292 domain-containing protein [Blautia liquoris]QOV18235.1 DUF1292 domain-containing protein [Blautia liquoris]